MKRSTYEIRVKGELVSVKFAWNAACREVEALARQLANKNRAEYRKYETFSDPGADGYGFASGYRVWRNMKTGEDVTFDIQKTS
jgi:hypothetical protein